MPEVGLKAAAQTHPTRFNRLFPSQPCLPRCLRDLPRFPIRSQSTRRVALRTRLRSMYASVAATLSGSAQVQICAWFSAELAARISRIRTENFRHGPAQARHGRHCCAELYDCYFSAVGLRQRGVEFGAHCQMAEEVRLGE